MNKKKVDRIGCSSSLFFLPSKLLFRIVIPLFFYVSSSAVAQFKSELQLGYVYDSNVFGNFAEIPDGYLMANLRLDNYTGWNYSSLDLSYSGALSSYSSYPEEDSWAHNLSAGYKIQLSRVGDNIDSTDSSSGFPVDSLETYLTLAGSASRTVPHSGDFAAYQNFIASGLVNLRYPFGEAAVLGVAYGINYTGYDYVESLSNLENVGMASLSFNLTKGLFLYVGGSYGGKKYYGVDTVGTAVQNLIKMHTNNRYNGHGKGKGKNSGNPAPAPSSSAKTYVLDSPSAGQAAYGAGANWASGQWRAGAGILFRVNEAGEARYIDYVAKFADLVSLVYDDPYSYHGDEINLEVGRDSLIFGVNAALGLNLSSKDYNRPALDTSQTTVVASRRHDNNADLSITLSKRFLLSGAVSGFTIGLEYHHIANSSNDEFYQFTDDVVNFVVGVELF